MAATKTIQRKDHKGKRYGRLTVIRYSHDDVRIGVAEKGRSGDFRKRYHVMWECRCDCGNIVVVRSNSLVTGSVQSCGCYQAEQARLHGKENVKHGMTGTKEYRAWQGLKNRCLNPNMNNYPDYGGRGIMVCDRWLESFENFYADVGRAPRGAFSIDRIDNDGDYEPGNCKWSTTVEQACNKRTNRLLTHDGRTQTVTQWADELGISRVTLQARVTRFGWSVERALTTPTNVKKRSKKKRRKAKPESR